MHVVMVSKAVVVGAYQRKLEELSLLPGMRLTVLAPPGWRDNRGHIRLERAYVHGYDLVETPLVFNGHFHVHFYPRLASHLTALRPDLIHVDEEPCNLATFHAVWLAQQLSTPACFFTWQNLDRAYPPPFRWFEKYVFRHVHHALAGNAEAIDILRRKGYQGPVTLAPQFGVDPQIFRPLTRPPSPCFVIGYAGGLVPEKGVDLLLRAAADLPDVEVRLAGSGAQQLSLVSLAEELGLAPRVQFLPRLASTAMPDFYAQLDALVLPSRTAPNWKEQFGRVLIEAMACGVPVIGAHSGEIPQVIGDAGLVFPEGDVLALRGCLRRLQQDPALRRDLAARGRARVLAHYTQARIAALTYGVYQQMLAIGAPPAPGLAVGARS
jgi:glycosyltransferase involved in cell wall biosynthesis